jgi:hydrogenase nickel incorporation protein HypA/HybF
MHEYSLIQSLVSRVEEVAREKGAVAVRRLVVSVGDLAGVDPELFETAFHTYKGGTVCEHAALETRRAEGVWQCPTCRRAIPRGAVLACERCGSPAEPSPGADAILLESVEMEVP